MSRITKEANTVHAGASEKRIASRVSIDVGGKRHDAKAATADEIRLSAYQKWERAGKPAGDGMQFWLEAEQELQ